MNEICLPNADINCAFWFDSMSSRHPQIDVTEALYSFPWCTILLAHTLRGLKVADVFHEKGSSGYEVEMGDCVGRRRWGRRNR